MARPIFRPFRPGESFNWRSEMDQKLRFGIVIDEEGTALLFYRSGEQPGGIRTEKQQVPNGAKSTGELEALLLDDIALAVSAVRAALGLSKPS